MNLKNISLVMLMLVAVSASAHTYTETSGTTSVDTRDPVFVPFIPEVYTVVSALTAVDTRNPEFAPFVREDFTGGSVLTLVDTRDPAFRPFASGAYTGVSGLSAIDSRDYTLTVVSDYGNPVPSVGVYSNYCWHAAVTGLVEAFLIDGSMEYIATGWSGTGITPAAGTSNVTGQILLTDPDAALNWNWLVEQWDADLDMLPDSWEQGIVDADPNDDISSLSDVLPGGDVDGDGIKNIFEYAFADNLHTNEPLFFIQIVDGKPVLQVPEQSTDSTRYIDIVIECSGDLQTWNVPVVPAATSNQPPSGKSWYAPMGEGDKAFFIIRAETKSK